MTKKKDYPVGYGKPPKHSQFKRGQSGNPKGRPKGAQSFSVVLDKELRSMVSVTENGKTHKVSKATAFAKALVAKAMRGDVRAVNVILTHSQQLQQSGGLLASEMKPIDDIILRDYERRILGNPEDDDVK